MKHEMYRVKNLPVITIDNYYSERVCEKVWQELCFLNNEPEKLMSPQNTGSAFTTNENNQKIFFKKNKGIFLDEVYIDRSISNILVANRKIFDDAEKLIDIDIFFRYIKESTKDKTLVQYYEDSDYYEYHSDIAVITAITWFYKTPKTFTGGELIFEDGPSIECNFNRTVIFPSILRHSVNQTCVPNNLVGKNFGRYSITQLITFD
jgi:hypothetical protein